MVVAKIFIVFLHMVVSSAHGFLTPFEQISISELRICLQIKGLPSSAFIPKGSSKIYQNLNYQWNTFNYIQPLAFIVPEHAHHVQSAVRCGRNLRIPMVAKSGGHSYEKYCFGNSSSVVIDFVRMDFITMETRTTAVVGPGLLIAQLQYYAWQQGLVIPTPLCVSVGVGGAILGGGYGYLSTKFGLMIDNILEMEMVDARGNLLVINFRRNEDLFWASRGGGGGNFGFVTKFKIQLHDASHLTYKYIKLEYTSEQSVSAEVFKSVQKYCLENVRKKSVFLFARFVSNKIVLTIIGLNLSDKSTRTLIKEFPEPGNKTIKLVRNYVDIVLLDAVTNTITHPADLKNVNRQSTSQIYNKVKSYYVKKVILNEDVQKLVDVLRRIPVTCSFAIFSFGGAINHVPKDATAFVHRDSIYTVEVKIRSNNSETISWLNDFQQVILLVDDGESYQNIVDGTLPDYLQRYYGSNLGRLREIKKSIDPDNYFNFPQSIPPVEGYY